MTYAFEEDKRFCDLVKHVLNAEGGYVNHPEDPGGPTKNGIALAYNADALKPFGIFNAEDMRTKMTPEIAKQIYYRRYWTAVMCQTIASDRLAYMHFDTAVNCGVGAACASLLKLTWHDKFKYLEAEGKNVDFWWKAYVQYSAARKRYYTRCKNRKPFIDGWVNRLALCDDHAVEMVD